MARRTRRGRAPRLRPRVEGLETRQLLAYTTAVYPLGSPSIRASDIVAGPGGLLWFTQTSPNAPTGAIGAINPANGAIATFPIPYANSDPRAIAWGPDGGLWFADLRTNAIGQFDPSNHAVVEYPTPTPVSGPLGIAAGPDGHLWFTESKTGKVGSINPATHAIAEYPLASSADAPGAIAAGPDGDLWFVESGARAIGQINPTTHARAAFPLALGSSGRVFPDAIATASDGTIAFAVTSDAATPGSLQILIETMNPTTHAVAPTSARYVTGPTGAVVLTGEDLSFVAPGVVAGPAGGVWFGSTGFLSEFIPIPADQDIIAGGLYIPSVFVLGRPAPTAPGRTVYVDLNGDGVFDAGDPSAVTDANGGFVINAVPPGTYTMRVVDLPGDVTSTRTITLTGGQMLTAQSLLLQPTAAILPLTYTLTPFGPSNPDVTTAEVTALYTIVLGRAPDAAGLAGWVGAIKGGLPYAQVVVDFLSSAAYDQRVVAADYQTFAGRAPTPAESAAWVNLMQQHYTEEQIAYLMLTSSGFNAAHADNGSFVQALYNDLLGRQASASEVSAWSGFLAGGASRGHVVYLFLHSQAAYQRAVDGLFAITLGRPADPGGEAFYVSGLDAGAALTDITRGFLTSDEYIRRADATVKG